MQMVGICISLTLVPHNVGSTHKMLPIICDRLSPNVANIKLIVLCWKHSPKLRKSSYMFGFSGQREREREIIFCKRTLWGFQAQEPSLKHLV